MSGRSLVVSIHDVSPATMETTGRMLVDLREAGVARVSLLVIPDHHRRHRMDGSPEFLGRLAAWERDGHELVLHGYDHLRAARGGESLRDGVVTRIYTAGEGEFYDLGYEEAADRVRRGLEMFRVCGFDRVAGFVAPAWLLGEEAGRAVRDAGFRYTTFLPSVRRLADGAVHRSQSLVYSVRSGWRVVVSLVWNACLAGWLGGNRLARLGLHPPDWGHGAVRRQALRIAGGMAGSRAVRTYGEWVENSSF